MFRHMEHAMSTTETPGSLDKAIEIGTAQLEAMPEDTPTRERELLEEAVGDAWQNIAVLMREHQDKPFADYRPFCEQAVKYFPYQRREAAALLRNKGESALGSTARAQLQNRLSGSSMGQGSAKEALEKARNGEDFAGLAQEYSDGPTGPRGGDLGMFPRGRMVPAFDNAVFALEVNGLSEIVETPFGYHVIQRYR